VVWTPQSQAVEDEAAYRQRGLDQLRSKAKEDAANEAYARAAKNAVWRLLPWQLPDAAAASQTPVPELAPLPEGWERVVSRSTGDTYYYNAITQETTYEHPTGAAGGLKVGQVVVIKSLVSKPENNGKKAVVERFDAKNECYAVRVGAEVFFIKQGNLTPLETGARARARARERESGTLQGRQCVLGPWMLLGVWGACGRQQQ
jgi:hypothetical protein